MVTPWEHPHATAVHNLMRAFTERDRPTIEALLAPGCVWRVPGHNALAGEYAGRAEVMGLFGMMRRILTQPATFEVIDIAMSGDRVIVFQYGVITIGDRVLRMKERLIYRFEADLIAEVDEFQYDQAAFDAVFAVGLTAGSGPT
ncbi:MULTISPECIES: nuclear transport factor 2 family protein [Protofrankia]|uniref:SnoaL-like domain-containing protein n=1 Tax=Protofrankia coriariae TaxID=1562887 RepID=A0ABR5EZA6_9ACTN|nr:MULTISPECIES: nuclear transport factor 2 family protein [Protofrankia]KLL09794.1 hypothetical protein FrCorBMG51_22420 [Protofrankia coriariae]